MAIKILSLLCIAVMMLSCSGCSKSQSTGKNTKESDSSFTAISEEYITGYLKWRPQSGTYLGLHEYDGKVTDYSKKSIEEEIKRLKEYDAKLGTLDTILMNTRIFYDYKILRAAIRKELFDLEETRGLFTNPMSYAGIIDVNIYIKRNFAPIEERIKSIIAIEKEAPKIYTAARENLDESLPKPFIETAIQVARGSADFLSKDLPEALKDVKNPSLMAELKQVNTKAIEEINSYADYLEKEKLPKANNNFALGKEKYQKMLQYGELITLTPEEILEIGMDNMRNEQKLFEETAKIIDPNKKAVEVYQEIQKDHPTAQSLIPDTRKNMESIRQYLIDKKIVSMPTDVRVQVEETPPYARATSFASMDTPGPYETKATEAYYYVTPVDMKWPQKQQEEWLMAFNYYTTDIVTIHEAYPGHYTQFVHLNHSPSTKVEKIFGSYAFTEGWAHYTELMMLEEGFAKDKGDIIAAKYKLAQLGESLLRYCRLCVSIMMHTQGMTPEQGTKFFMDNCYYVEKPASSEALRGTYDPGYLYYTLGKLQILKLREDYKEQEGDNFSLQKFHDTVLGNGMPPVALLREIMLKNNKIWGEIL